MHLFQVWIEHEHDSKEWKFYQCMPSFVSDIHILTIREKVGIRHIYFSFLQFEPLTTCSSIFEQIDECLS